MSETGPADVDTLDDTAAGTFAVTTATGTVLVIDADEKSIEVY